MAAQLPKLFVAAGAALVVSDRDAATAAAVAEGIAALGGQAIAVACDVTREEYPVQLIAQAVQRGALSTGLSNAAINGTIQWILLRGHSGHVAVRQTRRVRFWFERFGCHHPFHDPARESVACQVMGLRKDRAAGFGVQMNKTE